MANIGFGNFSGGFGNSQALGFGNLPSLGFGNFSVGFGNFQARGFGNSLPLGFGNCQALGFGNFEALGFGNSQALGFGNLPIPLDSETSASDSETPRPSDSETCLSPWIRKLQRRIRKLPGPRIRKLAYPPGFGNFNVGFGNFQAFGFGNLPFPPDSETSASDSETPRPSDSETCLSPRIRKLQRRIRTLPGPRIWKLAVPRIRKLQRQIRKLPGPRIRKLCHRQSVSSINTSSTAQGGGGSFKNRKPIGDVGCCESRMAERIHWLTERWLELCLLEWLQWLQWSPHPQLLDVVWCTATVVVVVG